MLWPYLKLKLKLSLTIWWYILWYSGPACCSEDAGVEPSRAGGAGPDQWGGQEWVDLFPRVLSDCDQEIQRGGPGGLQAEYVQGSNILSFVLSVCVWRHLSHLC